MFLVILLVITNGRLIVYSNRDLMQVVVEESFPHHVLLTDDPKLVCSCLLKYDSNMCILLVVTNGRLTIKWALNKFNGRCSRCDQGFAQLSRGNRVRLTCTAIQLTCTANVYS